MRRAALAVPILLLLAPAAWAGPRWPNLNIGLGGSLGIAGDLTTGGFAASTAALWPIEGPWSFGVQGFINDMGNDVSPTIEPGSPPVSFGTIEHRHRFLWGGGWRLDAKLPDVGRWETLATASWDAIRIQDDARGVILGAESTNGVGIGLGIRRPVLQHSTVGVQVRYHHLFNELVDSFTSAEMEWGWRFGKTP